jgi:hypothetical protein
MDRSSAVSIRRRGAPESTKAKYPAPQSQPIQPLLGVAFTTTSRQIKRASNSPQQESCWPKDGAKIEIRWSTSAPRTISRCVTLCPIGARKKQKNRRRDEGAGTRRQNLLVLPPLSEHWTSGPRREQDGTTLCANCLARVCDDLIEAWGGGERGESDFRDKHGKQSHVCACTTTTIAVAVC